jgi:hypothetical protein
MNRKLFAAGVLALILIVVVLSAFVASPQSDEDRPPIIVSSGSVILSVANGSWVREAAGRYRQDVVRGKDVKSFSASTGTGGAVCTVSGTAILVTYGANAISFGRAIPSGQAGRNAANAKMPGDAAVTLKDSRTLVITTTDPLGTFSNGGTGPGSSCQVAAGRLEIRQVH